MNSVQKLAAAVVLQAVREEGEGWLKRETAKPWIALAGLDPDYVARLADGSIERARAILEEFESLCPRGPRTACRVGASGW